MDKQINARIQQKIDTYKKWEEKEDTFIPLKGEIIIYTPDEGEEGFTKMKIGDGVSPLKNLQFITSDSKSSSVQFIIWEEED